jgi:hypothetical protein
MGKLFHSAARMNAFVTSCCRGRRDRSILHEKGAVIMDDEPRDELLIAALPDLRLVKRLREGLDVPAGSHDIYLAYGDGRGGRFDGLLISGTGSIDRLIAYCPVSPDLVIGSGMWRREVRRQRQLAVRIATRQIQPGRSLETIWLAEENNRPREIPRWIFSLGCVPLTFPWDGRLLYPRPFCPKLFESMARQPQAPRWILQRMAASVVMRAHAEALQSPQ